MSSDDRANSSHPASPSLGNAPSTTLLIAGAAAAPGDGAALERLISHVYTTLHAMAAKQMRGEADGHTLGATALANEAYIKLQGNLGGIQNRAHFFASAAQAMRAILIDHARRRDAAKRGGKDLQRCPLDEHLDAIGHPPERLMELDDALEAIAAADENGRLVDVARMKIYARMTAAQIGTALGISTRTIERDIEFIRVLLKRRFNL